MAPRLHALRRPFAPCLLLTAVLHTALATGCGDDGVAGLDNFDVEVSDQTVVPGATALELLLGTFPELDGFTRFDISQEQEFQNKDYSPSDVDSVILETLTLRVVDPAGQDLSFLGGMIVYIEADGLERKEIARRDDFPEGEGTVSFTTSNDDIKAYVLSREGTVTVDVLDSKRPDQDTTIEMKVVFDVDVNVL